MISHHLRFANANASLLLNSAICNFQWGPPNVGPNKAPSFKAKGTIWFSNEFILSTKENGHKELGQATGFTNTYCPKTTAYPLVRIIWNVKILENAYNRPLHQFFVLPKPKDCDGLCEHSESSCASRPPLHNWLTSTWTHAWDDDCSL